jgi:hypothetical protein
MSRLNWEKVNLLTKERNRKIQYSSDNLLAPPDRPFKPQAHKPAQETRTESRPRPRLIKEISAIQEKEKVEIASEVVSAKTLQGKENSPARGVIRILRLSFKK